MNQQAPVQGRKWSDGDFSANVTADFVGLLLHAAMGGLSSDTVPSTDHELLVDEPLTSGEKQLVLAQQPSDGGALLGILITGTSEGGTISVSGIDAEGNGASENITFASAGSFFTRNSFSAIGASSLTINANSEDIGSATVYGYKYFKHTFSASDQNPTYSIERVGDPAAGDAASRSFMHGGMVLQSITFNTPAATRDGVFSVDSTWEGRETAACDATTIQHASTLRIWPAWSLSISRDNVSWHKAKNQTFTINAGNRNYRTAAGVQGPQGAFHGGRELTGSNEVLLEDETEFNRWRGASRLSQVFYWVSPWALTSNQNQALTASFLGSYTENVDGSDSDGEQTLSMDYRNTADAEADLGKFTLIGPTPRSAYGASMSLSQA
jgi:hypothetical protein